MLSTSPVLGAADGQLALGPGQMRTIDLTLDRFALADTLHTPRTLRWPLHLVVRGFAHVAAPAKTTTVASTAKGTGNPERALFFGLQAAGPPQSSTAVAARFVSRLLHYIGCMVLIGLAIAALIGASHTAYDDEAPREPDCRP